MNKKPGIDFWLVTAITILTAFLTGTQLTVLWGYAELGLTPPSGVLINAACIFLAFALGAARVLAVLFKNAFR